MVCSCSQLLVALPESLLAYGITTADDKPQRLCYKISIITIDAMSMCFITYSDIFLPMANNQCANEKLNGFITKLT